MLIGREDGINQLLHRRRDLCDQQILLDIDPSKMSQPLKRTFVLDAADEKVCIKAGLLNNQSSKCDHCLEKTLMP